MRLGAAALTYIDTFIKTHDLSQFEVVNKEDTAQSRAAPPQPGQSTASRGVPWAPRPPRPAVRLSTHPYQPARQVKNRQQEDMHSDAVPGETSAAHGVSQGYQQLALLPIPEPEQAAPGPNDPVASPSPTPALPRANWGHLSDPTPRHPPRQGRHVAAPAQQQRQAALSPSRAPLEHFAEQLQADLGGSLGRPPSPYQPTQQSTPLPHPETSQPQSAAPASSPESVRAAAAAAGTGVMPRQLQVAFPLAAASSSGAVSYSPEPPRDAAGRPEGPSQIRQVLQQPPPGPTPPLRPVPIAEAHIRGMFFDLILIHLKSMAVPAEKV